MLTIRVPATSANLGPGFDCVGIALNLYNEFYFYQGSEIELSPGIMLLQNGSLAHQGMNLVATTIDKKVPELKIAIKAAVPRSRGLGSSATLTVAGIVAANVFLDAKLKEEELILLASRIEGHPDNAAPALLGGLVISAVAEELKYIKVHPRNPFQVIVAVPDFELATSEARKVLPELVSHRDAVFNTGRFGLLMTSFLTGDYSLLNFSMEDRLHQPYRMPLVPGLQEVMTAAVSSGALGSCLSGAGPSVLAFCNDNVSVIRNAMGDTWRKSGISAKTYLLEISSQGTECIQK